ncbi:MAG: response regulator transcription factor [Acidimicrobiaceae bacterium]|nr:response regulator transcription factor [Acidimicrobiaceae bacterium]
MAKILLIDDDKSLLRALEIALSARGHELNSTISARQGIELVALFQPDVVILDLGLPDLDGVQVVKELRGWTQVPILVLSASGDEKRKVQALDLGADDYVTKPFAMAELEARIRVALKHASTRTPEIDVSTIKIGDLEIDIPARSVLVGTQSVELTQKEFDLVAYLAKNAGKVCTHQMILREVWGSGLGDQAHYLRVYVSRIRKKLFDEEAELVRTVPGVGYQLTGKFRD